MAAITVGDLFVYERTFTDAEVIAFVAFSCDRGRHHLERDARGRLLVHGLLTATLPTKLGGDLDLLARELRFEFLRPVFTGDLVRCEMRVVEVERQVGRTRLGFEASCRNQDGKEVLRGGGHGVILDEARP